MDLVAVLSNNGTEVLYQRLASRNWRQVRRPPAKPRDRAVLPVLADADGPLRFVEIHRRVEERLGFPVPRAV